MNDFLYTSHTGNNDDLIKEVSKLYLFDKAKIADVTYGKGVFWKKVDLKQYDFHPSDLITVPTALYDFTKLPYKSKTFDVVVFDPPYAHNPGKMMVNDNYKNSETTKGFYHKDIIDLYKKGMVEANRILKENGTLWVKCQDEIESSLQRWSHIEIFNIALNELNLIPKDLFVLTQNKKPFVQHTQKHARKNHSYLWIFSKLNDKSFKNYYKKTQNSKSQNKRK